MTVPFADHHFLSFDGSEEIATKLYFPDRYRAFESLFKSPGTFSVQGANLSYPALSFGKDSSTVQMTQFNRILSFDAQTGLIEVESGMTLGELASFSIPRGYFLKVQPGHPSITLGGCLGADVHGKNQFLDLNFKEQVAFLKLYHPRMGFIDCDRTTHPEIFHLTCGGFGLSGIAVSLGIQLGRLPSGVIDTETLPLENIFELPKLLKERSTSEDLLYSWHDFNRFEQFGRGFLKVGRSRRQSGSATDEHESALRVLKQAKPLSAKVRARMPVNLLNRYTVPLINKVYSTSEMKRGHKTVPLAEFLFPVLNKTAYFSLFGRTGFHESQVLIPFEKFEDVVRALKQVLQKSHLPVTLASCKLFTGEQELLRFLGNGVVLAINLPRVPEALEILHQWDEIVKEAKCLPNIAKDSRLPVEIVRACYPKYEEFRTRLHAWDSERLFRTSLSQRLQL